MHAVIKIIAVIIIIAVIKNLQTEKCNAKYKFTSVSFTFNGCDNFGGHT